MQHAAYRLALWQVMITAGVAVASGWIAGPAAAGSALVGGGIGIVTGLYQATRLFAVDASESPERFMRAAYVGEIVKIVLTASLFVFAIKALNVQFAATIVAYGATYIVYWVALTTGYPWIGDTTEAG